RPPGRRRRSSAVATCFRQPRPEPHLRLDAPNAGTRGLRGRRSYDAAGSGRRVVLVGRGVVELARLQGLDRLADALAVGRVGLGAVLDVLLDGGLRRAVDGPSGVLEERL